MPYRGEVFTRGQYYHIYNRGAGEQKIFFNEANYAYLLRQMALCSRRYCATPIAYCLMPNHYHFLLRQESDEPLSKFILQLSRYIHMNPVSARLVSCPEDWAYSDYAEWVGLRKSSLALGDRAFVRHYFPNPEEYRKFVLDAPDRATPDGNLREYAWD